MEGHIKKLTMASTVEVILGWGSSIEVQRRRWKRHLSSAINLGTGSVNDEASETGEILFREELGEVVGNIVFRRTPEASYPRRLSVVADSVAYAEMTKLYVLRLLTYFGVIRSH
jgi:hypothetical protein